MTTQRNKDSARAYIEALTGSPDAAVTFQTFSDIKPPKGDANAAREAAMLARVLHGTVDQHWDNLGMLNDAGAGIFVTVNETDGNGRTADNVVSTRAYFADFDLKPEEMDYSEASQILEPTFSVESSPGKTQAYWRLTAPVPIDQWKRTQAAIIARLRTDPACKDPSRVLRLPGTFHRKEGGWRLVGIKSLAGPEYGQDEIARVFRAAAAPKPAPSIVFAKDDQVTGDGRRDQLLTQIGVLLNDGMTSPREIRRSLQEYANAHFSDGDPVDWANIGKAIKDMLAKHKVVEQPFVRDERDAGCDLADLVMTEFEPYRFVCYPFICEGYTIYVGKPKIGKTTLMRQLVVAANGGASFMGFECNKTQCLFLSLEESQRQFKKKIEEMNYGLEELRGVRMEWKWPRGDAAISELRLYLNANPSTKLIVIDSLAAIKGPNDRNKTLFQNDYDFGHQMESICHDHPGLAIIAIHHTRKMESEDPADLVSGSTGVTAGCTTFCVLHTVPTGYAMHWEGRNWPEDHNAYEIARDSGRWRYIGILDPAMEKLAPNATGQAAIIAYLREHGTVTQVSIARDLNMKQPNVSAAIKKLITLGLVVKMDIGFRLVEK